jgi:hypothetical protein
LGGLSASLLTLLAVIDYSVFGHPQVKNILTTIQKEELSAVRSFPR